MTRLKNMVPLCSGRSRASWGYEDSVCDDGLPPTIASIIHTCARWNRSTVKDLVLRKDGLIEMDQAGNYRRRIITNEERAKIKRKILKAIQAGNNRRDAHTYAGVTSTCFYEWLSEDDDFHDAVVQAEAHAKVAHVTRLAHAAAAGSWQASLAWLERKFPREWGKTATLDVNFRQMSEDDIKAYISQRLGLDEPAGASGSLSGAEAEGRIIEGDTTGETAVLALPE